MAALWLLFAVRPAGFAVEYRLLHGFPTNSYPQSALVFGQDGAMYGTTQMGGDYGYGSLFRITINGDFTNLISFGYTNGAYPYSGLARGEDGSFYGTAQNGGAGGYGTVFRVTAGGEFTHLAAFANTNGAYPKGVLTVGRDHALYGTTLRGGNQDYGTIFRITTNGALTSLASFAQTNGAYPVGGLVQGRDGAFYGSTQHGGVFDGFNGFGTIYRVTGEGALTIIYALEGYGDAYPLGELLQMEDGLLYGVTGGSVFRVSTNGAFTRIGYNPIDLLYPRSGLMRGFDGALYGMASDHAFRITTNGVVMNLFPFYNFWNGADPRGGLVQGPDTALYGTTAQGGPFGGGAIFRLELTTYFYPLTRAANGWNVLFVGLPGNTYKVLRSAAPLGPWSVAANVITDDYGLGRWLDTSAQDSTYYRLVYP